MTTTEPMSRYALKHWLLENGADLISDACQDTPLGDLAMAVMDLAAADLTEHTLDSERALRGAVYAYQEARENEA